MLTQVSFLEEQVPYPVGAGVAGRRGWGPCGRPRWGSAACGTTSVTLALGMHGLPRTDDPQRGRPQGPHPLLPATPPLRAACLFPKTLPLRSPCRGSHEQNGFRERFWVNPIFKHWLWIPLQTPPLAYNPAIDAANRYCKAARNGRPAALNHRDRPLPQSGHGQAQ